MTTYTPPPATAPAMAPPPQKSSGCLKYGLIGCGIAVVLLAILVVVVIAVVFGAIKSTDVYKGALHRAQQDPRVIAVLGSPVKGGVMVGGNVSIKDKNGAANINFPIRGPKGKAEMRVQATLDESGWHYSVLKVVPEQGPPIDLMTP